MFCDKCGTENKKGAKFCTKCGEALKTEEKAKSEKSQPVNIDAGGLRKKMKADAKKNVSGSLVGATVVYFLICIVISMIFTSSTANVNGTEVVISTPWETLGSLLTSLVGLVFGFGVLLVGFNAVRGKSFTFGDVFVKPFSYLKQLGYILLLGVIIVAITIVGIIIPILGWIALIVSYIYFYPVIEMFSIILADVDNNKDISFGDAFKKAMEITKGHRVEFYGVTFSFIGWLLLAPFTLGILLIWLIPYMELTKVNLYRKWVNEETFTTDEKGMSNGAVVGLTVGGCGCGCLVMLTAFIGIVMAIAMAISENNADVRGWIYDFAKENNIQIDDADFNDMMNEIDGYNR